jgi:hypothetical protein
LGWQPETEIKEGIRNSVEYFIGLILMYTVFLLDEFK